MSFLAMISLLVYFVFDRTDRVDEPCMQRVHIRYDEILRRVVVLQQCQAVARDVRPRAFVDGGVASRPNDGCGSSLVFRQEPASPAFLQAAAPAGIALPRGLVR